MLVYRIHPIGADLHGVETECSDGTPAGGVHVFESIAEIQAVSGWLRQTGVEVATVECDRRDVRQNGDYEGSLLLAGRGKIVGRKEFADSDAIARWAACAE